MPCIFCNQMYKKNPCIRDGKYDSEPTLKELVYHYHNKGETKKLVTASLLLHGHCPCETCLIKMMCVTVCEEYKSRVINPIKGVPK